MKHEVKVLIDDNGKPILDHNNNVYLTFPVWYKGVFIFDSGKFDSSTSKVPPIEDVEIPFYFSFWTLSNKAYYISRIFPKTVRIEQDLNNCELIFNTQDWDRTYRSFRIRKLKEDTESFSGSVTVTLCVDHYYYDKSWIEVERILNGEDKSEIDKILPDSGTTTSNIGTYYPGNVSTFSWSLL